MVGLWNDQKTKLMKIQLSPVVPYVQILLICDNNCNIVSLYGSSTTRP